jgi:hypothetical protein
METNLNFENAEKALRIGLRAKLPEWTDDIFIKWGNGQVCMADSKGNSFSLSLHKDYSQLILRNDWISY